MNPTGAKKAHGGRRTTLCADCRTFRSPTRYRSYGAPDVDTEVEGRQGSGLAEIAVLAYGDRREGLLRMSALTAEDGNHDLRLPVGVSAWDNLSQATQPPTPPDTEKGVRQRRTDDRQHRQ